jgi:hypothetical protein
MVTRHFLGFVGFKRQLPLLADCELNHAEIHSWWWSAFWPKPEINLRSRLHSLTTQGSHWHRPIIGLGRKCIGINLTSGYP